ncbi:unnamed protein product [Phytophthora fragariaefolia]|uniref:Unnamed protein product n=1 Tax=Phytophthora fragariaefolia TaxID=1490495 RepID=A0A9W7D1Q6_9STRA|nr:unnamed protein product [Phytophthora fragariaefolia]
MTTLIDDGPVLPELLQGERYGWWAEHDPEEEKRQAAVVHGAVNDSRTQILLDTGAKVSRISLDLARRLKLKLKLTPAKQSVRVRRSPDVCQRQRPDQDYFGSSWRLCCGFVGHEHRRRRGCVTQDGFHV